jgi:hypothetical protein
MEYNFNFNFGLLNHDNNTNSSQKIINLLINDSTFLKKIETVIKEHLDEKKPNNIIDNKINNTKNIVDNKINNTKYKIEWSIDNYSLKEVIEVDNNITFGNLLNILSNDNKFLQHILFVLNLQFLYTDDIKSLILKTRFKKNTNFLNNNNNIELGKYNLTLQSTNKKCNINFTIL